MTWIAWLALPAIAAFLALLLRRHQPEYALLVGLITGVLLLVWVLAQAQPIISVLDNLLNSAGLPGEYSQQVFKALGVCLLTQLSADACRDAGETGLAGKAELAGKILLLILALPLLESIAETSAALIHGA